MCQWRTRLSRPSERGELRLGTWHSEVRSFAANVPQVPADVLRVGDIGEEPRDRTERAMADSLKIAESDEGGFGAIDEFVIAAAILASRSPEKCLLRSAISRSNSRPCGHTVAGLMSHLTWQRHPTVSRPTRISLLSVNRYLDVRDRIDLADCPDFLHDSACFVCFQLTVSY